MSFLHERPSRESPALNFMPWPKTLHCREVSADFFMGHGEGQVRFIGHGIGLEIDEFPVIAPNFEGELAQGMVIAFEPKFVFPGKGVVGMEDDYVVTSSGVERLTLTDQVLIKLRP